MGIQIELEEEDVLSLDNGTPLSIVFTSVDDALLLLQYACRLPVRLKVGICLLVAQPASYPAQLVSPAMLASFTVRYFKSISASQNDMRISNVVYPVTRAELGDYLVPNSIILVAGRKQWWPTEEQRLAIRLANYGHRVIFVPSGHSNY